MKNEKPDLQLQSDKAIAALDALVPTIRNRLSTLNPSMNLEAEVGNLRQLLQRQPQLAATVVANPTTLASALFDLAKMGLSLNPVLGQAYVKSQRPYRDAKPELWVTPSYKGLQTCALRSGAVKSIVTELVYEKDTFQRGVSIDGPCMEFRMATGDRGNLLGGFCLTRMANDEKLVEWMDVAELEGCKLAATQAAGGVVPFTWTGPFRGEMYKKCISRRASKHWQIDLESGSSLMTALSRVDSDVGLPEFGESDAQPEAGPCVGDEEIQSIRAKLTDLDAATQDLWMLRKAQAMGFNSIRDVPAAQADALAEGLVLRMHNLAAARAGRAAEPAPAPAQPPQAVATPVPAQEVPAVAVPEPTPPPEPAPELAPQPPKATMDGLLEVAAARRKRRAK